MPRWSMAILALVLASMTACGAGEETVISRLLATDGRELTDVEFKQVLDAMSARLAEADSLREERIVPDPSEQCDGCPARIDMVRRDDGSVVLRSAATLQGGEEGPSEYSVTCPGSVDAPAYVIHRNTEDDPWAVFETTADQTYGAALVLPVAHAFPPRPALRIVALGEEGDSFRMAVEMENETSTLTLDRDGRMRQAESHHTFEGGERTVYAFEYDVEASVDLPDVEADLSCLS